MIRAVIIDDEKNNIDNLAGLLKKHALNVEVTGIAKNGDDGIEVILGTQAVKFAAIDYLLKPINPEELKISIAKVESKLNEKKGNLQLENLLELIKHKDSKKEHKLALATTKEIRFVNTGDIVRCESSNAYTKFYLVDGKSIMVSKPIFEYEELLNDYDFI